MAIQPKARLRRVAVYALGCAMVAGGVPRLMAYPQSATEQARAADVKKIPPMPERAKLEEMYKGALLLAKDTDPRIAARGRKLVSWYEILAAKNRSEQRALIKALPVTILYTASNADNGPTTVEFVARGKTRIRLLRSAPAVDLNAERQASGPSDAAASEECYDGEPPCVTWEEMEELAIFTADSIAEFEAWEANLNAEIEEYQQFCNQNPWACGAPGPCADANCWSKAADATVATVAAISAAVLAEGTVTTTMASGWKLTLLGKAALVGSVFAAGYVAGTYIDQAFVCFYYPQERLTGR